MGLFLVMVRRSLWVLLIGAVGGVAYSYWRDRNVVEPAGPPEWPPLPTPEPTPVPTPPVAVANKTAATSSSTDFSTDDSAVERGCLVRERPRRRPGGSIQRR